MKILFFGEVSGTILKHRAIALPDGMTPRSAESYFPDKPPLYRFDFRVAEVEDFPAGRENDKKFCPDCGKRSLRTIEVCEPDLSGEFREIFTCDACENMIHAFRDPK